MIAARKFQHIDSLYMLGKKQNFREFFYYLFFYFFWMLAAHRRFIWKWHWCCARLRSKFFSPIKNILHFLHYTLTHCNKTLHFSPLNPHKTLHFSPLNLYKTLDFVQLTPAAAACLKGSVQVLQSRRSVRRWRVVDTCCKIIQREGERKRKRKRERYEII